MTLRTLALVLQGVQWHVSHYRCEEFRCMPSYALNSGCEDAALRVARFGEALHQRASFELLEFPHLAQDTDGQAWSAA